MKNIKTYNFSKYIISMVATIALTTIWVQAWQWLTAQSGDKLDYQKWNELVNTVQSWIPSWFVWTFNLASCPTGWTEYTAARWRTIIWVWNGAWSNESLWATGWDKSKPSMSGVTATTNISVGTSTSGWAAVATEGSTLTSTPNSPPSSISAAIYLPSGTPQTSPITLWWVNTIISGGGTAPDNMQPYVALLYCIKN